MVADAKFLFTVCQIGAEIPLKSEVAREWPALRFAYSRPGFVTFKLPAGLRLAMDFDLRSTFARTYGFSLGKATDGDSEHLVKKTWQLAGNLKPQHLHVWQRDSAVPGINDFEPGITPLAHEIGQIVSAAYPSNGKSGEKLAVNQLAPAGQLVLDCVLVEPSEWWIGFHEANSMPSRWPGGVPLIDRQPDAISRAYLKVAEALLWSRMPIKRGDLCVEIGSAPGGSAAALLERGFSVMGIDPADMDDEILGHPDFVHVKKRASDMKRRDFRGAKWLFADPNISPKQTLDMVEDIVRHRDVHVRGMLLTLKLSDWQLAEQIPKYIERIRGWGFNQVQSRQLAFNRQEVCIAARRARAP